jgi:Ser-tRNA(Ala) deacylase AlaX
MPDGGVHVRSTGEIGTIVIHSINNADNQVSIRYGVAGRGSE